MASHGGECPTSSTDADTSIDWVPLVALLVSSVPAVRYLWKLILDHDGLDHAPDACTVNYTGTNRLLAHMERDSSSTSEIPAALDGRSQGDGEHAPDACTVNYTGINRLPAHMERGSSSSSEIPAALDGSQGDVAACLLDASNLQLFDKLEVATCVVCLEDILDDEEVLPCMHQFHLACIKKWLERSHTCPHCRDFVCRCKYIPQCILKLIISLWRTL